MTTQLDPTVMSEQVKESSPIEFPAGLIGLEEWRRFILIAHPDSGPLCLLQSLDDARMSLIVADPRQLVADYQISLAEADIQALQLPAGQKQPVLDGENVSVYCILSVQAEPFTATANLLGPVVINWQAGLGRQVILSNSGYEPRFLITGSLTSEELKPATGKESERC